MPLDFSEHPDNARSSNTIHTYSITDENDAVLIVLNDIDNHTISRLYIKHKDGSETNGVKVELSKDNDLSERSSIVSGDVTEDSHFFIPSFNKYILIQGLKDKNPVEVQFISTSGFNVYNKKDNWDFQTKYTLSNRYILPRHPKYPYNYWNDPYKLEDTIETGVETYLYNWEVVGGGVITFDIDSSELTPTYNLYKIPIVIDVSSSSNNVYRSNLIGTPKYDFLQKCVYAFVFSIKYPSVGLTYPHEN